MGNSKHPMIRGKRAGTKAGRSVLIWDVGPGLAPPWREAALQSNWDTTRLRFKPGNTYVILKHAG